MTKVGYKQSEEHKRKRGASISAALTGYKQTEEHKRKVGDSMKGRKILWADKIGANAKRRWANPEYRAKMMLGLSKQIRTKKRVLKNPIETGRKLSISSSKLYTDGNFNFKGYFFSQKNNAMIGYRSEPERLCMQIFEQLSKLVRYDYEKDAVPYVDSKGLQRHTIPDFHLYWNDGSEEIIEYKPNFKIKNNLHNTNLKLSAMESYAKQKGLKFSVWSESNVNLK